MLDRTTRTVLPDDTVTTMQYGFGNDRDGVLQFQTIVTDANGKRKVSYRDVQEQITSVQEFLSGQTLWTSYRYDPLKQIVEVRDDRSHLTRAEYDNLGRRVVLDNPDTGKTESQFDLAGNLVAKVTANLRAQGKAVQYTYDFLRLAKIAYPNFPGNDVTYQYGAPRAAFNRAGRIVTVDSEGGREERFYGKLGEVVKEIKTIASDTQGNSPNSPEVWTTEYLFDTFGRLQQLVYLTFGNGATSVFDNGHEKAYKYDDQGERVIKRGPQGETAYVNQWFTVRNREVASKHVYAGTTRITTSLVPGVKPVGADAGVTGGATAATGGRLPPTAQQAPGILAGRGLARRSAQAAQHARNVEKNPHYTGGGGGGGGSSPNVPQENFLYYYHPDHLGSSSYVTDSIGKVFEHLEYFPFGETWVEESSNIQRTPYLFTAKELDEETGLYYFGARYYDPRVSVWQSADPILWKYLPRGRDKKLPGMGGVFNPFNLAMYGYGHQNALKFVDPDGNEPVLNQVGMSAGFRAIVLDNSPSRVGLQMGAQAQATLQSWGSTEWTLKGPLPTTGYFNTAKIRYVYTRSGGWLDMSHFAFYAGVANQLKQEGSPNPVGEAMQRGYWQESTDAARAPWSAYSYEDLPSDRLGAIFGAHVFDPNSPKMLGEQIETFLNLWGADSPLAAPNIGSLPASDAAARKAWDAASPQDRQGKQNRTSAPRYAKPDSAP